MAVAKGGLAMSRRDALLRLHRALSARRDELRLRPARGAVAFQDVHLLRCGWVVLGPEVDPSEILKRVGNCQAVSAGHLGNMLRLT